MASQLTVFLYAAMHGFQQAAKAVNSNPALLNRSGLLRPFLARLVYRWRRDPEWSLYWGLGAGILSLVFLHLALSDSSRCE